MIVRDFTVITELVLSKQQFKLNQNGLTEIIEYLIMLKYSLQFHQITLALQILYQSQTLPYSSSAVIPYVLT